MFNRTVGAPPASNWCMSFVYTMWNKAAAFLGVKNPLARSGAVWRQVVHARRFGSGLRVIMAGTHFGSEHLMVLPGDLGILSTRGTDERLAGLQWTGHVYMVREDLGTTVASQEGNSNRDGSRSGYAVVDRTRRKDKTLCFIRHEDPKA